MQLPERRRNCYSLAARLKRLERNGTINGNRSCFSKHPESETTKKLVNNYSFESQKIPIKRNGSDFCNQLALRKGVMRKLLLDNE